MSKQQEPTTSPARSLSMTALQPLAPFVHPVPVTPDASTNATTTVILVQRSVPSASV
jgi:hypothetical protein